MRIGDLINVRFGRHEPQVGILVEIKPEPYLVERDGSEGAWYYVHAMGRAHAHRKHNLEIVNASR